MFLPFLFYSFDLSFLGGLKLLDTYAINWLHLLHLCIFARPDIILHVQQTEFFLFATMVTTTYLLQ